MRHPIWKSLALLLISLALLPVSQTAVYAGESCLKRVLDRYCLGGDFAALVRQPPIPLHQQKDGEGDAAIYLGVHGRVYVMAFRGRIYKILRQYRPSTQLRFQELGELLTKKYGPSVDRSRFPHYASSRGARVVAIRRGEGQAAQVWNPGSGWSVELSWTREMGVAVSYIADQLDAERQAAMGQGL
jgi:hypothetical protein